MNKEELLSLLNELKIDREEFTILSSGALVIRGIMDKANDLDIAVTKKGLEELFKNYNLIKKNEKWYQVNELVECVVDDMIGKKEKVNDYYLQDINWYLSFLESSNRQKDKDRIHIVKEYLENKK